MPEEEVDEIARLIRLMLKREEPAYSVAISAMAIVMEEILVFGCGWEVAQAQAKLASLFLEQNQ